MGNVISSCEVEIRVRYAEVDQMGALHHSRYWVYFEQGRTELFRMQGAPYRQCEERGIFFVVARCSARYRAPSRYDDVLVLKTSVAKMGRSRIDHAYELTRKSDGRLIATAETTLACVDRSNRVVSIPDFVRNAGR